MKHIAIIAIVTLAMLGVAHADTANKVPDNCGPTGKLFKHYIDEFDAAPTVGGNMGNGPDIMTIWQKPGDDQWVMIVSKPNGTSCVVSGGTHLLTAPYHDLDWRHWASLTIRR